MVITHAQMCYLHTLPITLVIVSPYFVFFGLSRKYIYIYNKYYIYVYIYIIHIYITLPMVPAVPSEQVLML